MINITVQENQLEFAKIDTINWFVSFCENYFSAENICRIYLLGSRASGHSSKGGGVRENSDHDFYVVLTDDCSEELHTGGSAWGTFYSKMNAERLSNNIGAIDAFVIRKTAFQHSAQDPDSAAAKALNCILIAEQG